MADTPEQIVNQALVDAGIRYRVGSLYEGSPEAKVALEVYGQTRDEMQRLTDWSFNRGVISLTLLKGPPPNGGYSPLQPWSNAYPDPGWLFEYAYPADCLDVRAIYPPPSGSMPDLDPLPALWRVENDLTPVVTGNPPAASGPPAKVILTNVNQAMMTYRRQVTDPALWDTGFIRALVQTLGEKLSQAFDADVSKARDQKTEAAVAQERASDVRG